MDTEAELLARIADGDDDARAVLADWWIEHGDEARGRFVQFQLAGAPEADALLGAHGDHWLASVTGYPREHLVFERGFLRYPLVLPTAIEREQLRLSPRVYRVTHARHRHRLAAREASCAGEGAEVLIAPATSEGPETEGTTDELGEALYRSWRAVVLPPGLDLRQLVVARPQPGLSCGLSVAVAICDRLAGPHARGALHGRLLRENVLLLSDGGVALTRTTPAVVGAVLGATFDFFAPEQIAGRGDARSDVFTIGLIACWLMTGDHPVEHRDTDYAAAMALRNGQYRVPSLAPALDSVLRRALAHRPADRFATAGELGSALRAAATVDVGPHVIAAVVNELSSSTRAPRPS